jgi:hypothetical protein
LVLSSVAAEAFLAATALVASGFVVARQPGSAARPAAIGLLLLAIAAALGAVRYSGVDDIIPLHTVASRLAGGGLAAVGVAWCGTAFRHKAWGWLAWAVLAAAFLFTWRGMDGPWRLPMSVGGVMFGLVGAASWLRSRPSVGVLGVVGAVGIAAAGLAFDTDSTLLGVPQVDLFHVSLATSVAAYVAGLVRTTTVDR